MGSEDELERQSLMETGGDGVAGVHVGVHRLEEGQSDGRTIPRHGDQLVCHEALHLKKDERERPYYWHQNLTTSLSRVYIGQY